MAQIILSAAGAGGLLLCGCAQFKAMDQPKPFKPTTTVVGTKRVNVAGELGSPLNSEEQNGHLVDTYKYVDGGGKNNAGSKICRVVLYTAGDLFTLFLDQIITWPAETYGFAGTPHIVTVVYEKGSDGFWHIQEVTDVEQVAKKNESSKSEGGSPKAKADATGAKPMATPPATEAVSTNAPASTTVTNTPPAS